MVFRKSRNTAGTTAAIQAGDDIGNIYFNPYLSTGSYGSIGSTMITSKYKGNGTTDLANLLFRTAGTDRLIITETGNVGIGTSTPNFKLTVEDIITADKAVDNIAVWGRQVLNLGSATSNRSHVGGRFDLNVDPSSTTTFTGWNVGVLAQVSDQSASNHSAGSIFGAYNSVQKTGGTIGEFTSTLSAPTIGGNAVASNIFGVRNIFNIQSSAKQPSVYGVYTSLSNVSTSAIGKLMYNEVQVDGGVTSTIDNLYGYHVGASLNYASATNKWAFYNDANIPSYYKGFVGVGTTAPQNPLHIISSGNTGGIRIDDANAWSAKLETNYLTFDRPGPAFVLNTSTDAAAMMRLGVGNNIPSAPTEGITIVQNGSVGVGTANPQNKLHIANATAGAIRIEDGTQQAGRVLTSDANGVGTWQAPTVGSATEPWYVANIASVTTQATSNTQDIFQSGRVGIGTNAPESALTIENDNISDRNDDIKINTFSATDTGAVQLVKALGTKASPQNLTNGTKLGGFTFASYYNGSYSTSHSGMFATYKGDGTNNRTGVANFVRTQFLYSLTLRV